MLQTHQPVREARTPAERAKQEPTPNPSSGSALGATMQLTALPVKDANPNRGIAQFYSGSNAATRVVQCWKWPSWLPWAEPEPDPLAGLNPQERQLVYFTNAIHREEQAEHQLGRRGLFASPYRSATEQLADHNGHVRDSTSSPLHETATDLVGKAGGAGSFIGSASTYLGNLSGNQDLGLVGNISKAGGAGLGVVGSLLSAGVGIHDIATSQEQYADKTIKGVGVAGALASAAQTGSNGLGTLATLLPNASGLANAAHAASAVIAPAAIATSAADVVTGLATGGLAHYRSNKLNELNHSAAGKHGIIKYAEDNQWLKAKANYGKAFGGTLGVLGGTALLVGGLASNPVGWGLLAGAAAVGLGMAAYKMYQKHQMGKAMLKDEGYRGLLESDQIVVDEEVPRQGIGDYFKTESMRRHDHVRGQIATHLARDERLDWQGQPNTASQIVDLLGVAEKPQRDPESLSLLDNRADQQQRAKAIAKGLDV